MPEMTTVSRADLDTLIRACLRYLPGMPDDPDPGIQEAFTRLDGARHEDAKPQEPPAGLADGYFAEIAFMGRIEYTGYVTQVTKHGQAAYHIDLPEKLWGGNPLAWVEHAASAWFSERPVTEASVRRQWEATVRAAAERARREAEWRDMQVRQALTAGDDDGEDLDVDDDEDEPLRWRD